ncbi:MAG: hypothetical protein KME57_08840 [Scytonema hyalinum WJT4-NPBG1]|jgi:hypothetical protein|nr:hypothetical protein [Scytonema hyalinum WJT4-NPBG1]
MIIQDLLPNTDTSDAPKEGKASETASPGREPLKHLLIGSPKAVTSTIHTLHRLGYADTAAWSPLVPTPNPGEVMSILTRYILVR